MQDTSIFQGMKELKKFTFVNHGDTWLVRKSVTDDFGYESHVLIGFLNELYDEENTSLYQRALELEQKSYEHNF